MNGGHITSDEPLRVGVVGGGFIGRTVGTDLDRHPLATVRALADIDESVLDETGSTLQVPPESRYREYVRMLESEALDAVLVGTPHTLHYEQVTAALDRGLHVLCDKPLTTDLEQARDLARRAETDKEVLMVGYQRHLNPAFVSARKRWRDSDLVPRFFTSEITQNWYSRFRDTWRTDPALSGGGYLYDTGSHLVDAALWTTGLTPRSVLADMTFADDAREVDVRATVTVAFENGASGTFSLFGDAPCVREHTHVWDDDGAVYLDGRQWEPRSLSTVDDESTTHTPYIDHRGQQTKADAFVEAIREGTEPPATARDALVVTAVSEAAYRSARASERVPVDL